MQLRIYSVKCCILEIKCDKQFLVHFVCELVCIEFNIQFELDQECLQFFSFFSERFQYKYL